MREIVDFLVGTRVMDLAANPGVLIACGILFVVALIMRWKHVLLFLFGIGAVLGIARHTGLSEGYVPVDRNMVVFAAGTLLVGVVVIYVLFIKGD